MLSGQEEALDYILEVSSRMLFHEIIEERNQDGNTPLHLAVRANQIAMTR